VFEPTGSRGVAASVIVNLPGYRVVDAVDLPLRGRRVKVQPVDLDDGCPGCGVVSSRVHAWVEQRVRDIPHPGRSWWWCANPGSFASSLPVVGGHSLRRPGSCRLGPAARPG
jgi:hypothetical protein